MIAAEDVDGNLLPALGVISHLNGKRVLDLGTGTGRLPLMLHDKVAYLVGLELYRGMLREHIKQRQKVRGQMKCIAWSSLTAG